ncbi:MAG TPA: carbonic anhydrase [Terriglobales bacterium]|nr:carbonic anhydrase [Terriglobales bacterium]
MRKIFHYESPRERYESDAAVVWCYDHRFDQVFRKLLKRIGIQFPDPVRIAGGAKTLASPARESDREFVLEQIRLSMELHRTKTVILMLHSDCGAYGGLKAFDKAESEAENHRQEMHRAARYLKDKFPELAIKAYFVDFEGVWEADLESSAEKIA